MAAEHPSPSGRPGPGWLARLEPGRRRDYGTGQAICLPGTEENRLFLLEHGMARICLNGGARDLTIGYLRPGGIFVTHTRAWVAALEPVRVMSWPVRDLLGLIAAEPEFAVAALREIGAVLHGAFDLIEDLAFRPVEARLARFLLAERISQGGDRLCLPERTEGLAEALGTTRQTLSSLVARLVRDGAIRRDGRRHLVILDPARLEKIADLSGG
ncbi:Crp/Fnr family transcriptional regulator [Poseidonocella sp. HB161398]|uniref:Crp/Fnr family transcriptional regulator n=1 Tax=Poseidonocella sp. HB161398 TaxID=2320855 RepID=UPI001107ED1C|nr:Crp/Fnr family transcriptional regulator [Poseidonocella sp. HB161398]